MGCLLASQSKLNKHYTNRSDTYPEIEAEDRAGRPPGACGGGEGGQDGRGQDGASQRGGLRQGLSGIESTGRAANAFQLAAIASAVGTPEWAYRP